MTEFPRGSTELSKDTRPIAWIRFADGKEWIVGASCDGIEPYDENGEMASVPWLAVITNGRIVARIPARMVSVHYA